MPSVPTESSALRLSTPGQIESLHWAREPRLAPLAGEVEIEVRAVSLNFKEVLLALGMLPVASAGDVRFGLECAGVISAVGPGVQGLRIGDEVLALGHRCLARHTCVPAAGVARIPPGISFSEAATLPVAFGTAYYALERVGRLRSGERVLVHAAAGGVGLASLQVARMLGAEVIATAGRPEKRAYLESLGVTHVFDSRSASFADEVRACTGGRGVDVVLNSLGGELVEKGLETLAPHGRFLELGVRGESLPLRCFEKGLTFALVMFSTAVPGFAEMWRELMDHFRFGRLQPLPFETFEADDVQAAFSRMARALHVGRLVIDLSDRAERASSVPSRRATDALQERFLSPEEGTRLFVRALSTGLPQVIISTTALEERLGARGEVQQAASPTAASGARARHARPDLRTAYREPRDDRERRLAAHWSELLGVEPIGIEDSFFDLGGDSLMAVQLVGRINKELGLGLSSHALLETPTIAALMDARLAAEAGTPASPIVDLKRGSGPHGLFLVHPIGGHVYVYRDIVRELPDDLRVFGLQSPAVVDPRSTPLASIEEIASVYLEAVRARQPSGPYALVGASFGGMVAYAMAQALEARGERISFVAMIDSAGPADLPPPLDSDEQIVEYLIELAGLDQSIRTELVGSSPAQQLFRLMSTAGTKLPIPPALSEQQLARFLDLWRTGTRAMANYAPPSSRIPIVYFRATERDSVNSATPDRSWRAVSHGTFELHEVPGNHLTMNYAPNMKAIARVLASRMESMRRS